MLRYPFFLRSHAVRPERPVSARVHPERRRAIRLILLSCLCLVGLPSGLAATGIRGLPFSRVYSLEDIGYVPRGSRLGFDRFGRVAVIHDGVYAVLNDTTWLNLADTSGENRVAISHVVQGRDGQTYYSGLGSWGQAAIGRDGRLDTTSLVPANPPDWTQSTGFTNILVTDTGVYFESRSGVVYWDPARKTSRFFEINKASRAFRVGNRIFVSRFEHTLQVLDVDAGALRDVPSLILDGNSDNVVEHATELDEHRALLSLLNGRLLVFDGTHATPWPGQTRHDLTGRITTLQRLADGNVAVSIAERGVFVLSPDGDLLSSLAIPSYHRVSDIASHEPGVMWLINEDSIEKILYSSGLTSFGQRLGVSPDWPLIVNWNDRIMIAAAGVLYETLPAAPGTTTRFERSVVQPLNGAWALAARGRHLLVGNTSAVYTIAPDGGYVPVSTIRDLTHLVMVTEDLCYAIGRSEIALLAWDGTQWTEPAARIPGVRNASIVHAADRSAWLEMGGDGVARVSWRDGRLQLMVVRNESWTRSLWVNIGVVGDTVVLSAARNERRFFSEQTGDWVARADLDRLLNRSPEWLARVRNDDQGNLWATHNKGLVKFAPKGGDYEMDVQSYDLINDRYPIVHVLPDNEVWVSASRSLYHVENTAGARLQAVPEPTLVSLVDARRNVELLTSPPRRFSYEQNSLTFRFFSGGYAWRRTPQYEFRLDPSEPWSALDTGSLLRFTGLHEGAYRLQVRIAGPAGAPGAPLTLPFEILPPWHRTGPAYLLYGTLLLLATLGGIRWSGQLARKRNRALAQLVQERTGQLESTMSKLNEETRITATLAERNRLAGEIHDSVQQGLSGAIIQLDTTLTLPALTGNLRNRLSVVRNMVSYARQEVQHAVWNLDSPLLEGNDLGNAIRKLTTFIASGTLTPSVVVTGEPVALLRSATHHLLRIAQEATTNAIRHAGARHIEIRLEYRPVAVALTIADDGHGFHPETVLNQAGHFGLRGLRTRVRKLGGQFQIISSPGEGTSIQVLVPIAAHPTHDPDPKTQPAHPNPNPVGR